MKQTLTVFLCSTYADLVDEREAVLNAIRTLQLQHDSMEFFGARTDQPLETCLEEVRNSDVLVVIVGHRYGSLTPEGGVSFSEAEYNEGYELGKPCLVYLRDEDALILPRNMEREPEKMILLEGFRAKLEERHTVAKFADSGGLAVQVTADLSRTVQGFDDSVRAGELEPPRGEAQVSEEIADLVTEAIESGSTEASVLSAVRQALASLLGSEGRRRPLAFLSHSSVDQPIVREVAKGLQDAGIDIWLDEDELRSGDRLTQMIQSGLDAADFMVYFISQDSMKSAWSQRELNMIMMRRLEQKKGAAVLPVRLDDAEVPALLRDVMYLDLRDGDVSRAVARLVEAIKINMERRRTS